MRTAVDSILMGIFYRNIYFFQMFCQLFTLIARDGEEKLNDSIISFMKSEVIVQPTLRRPVTVNLVFFYLRQWIPTVKNKFFVKLALVLVVWHGLFVLVMWLRKTSSVAAIFSCFSMHSIIKRLHLRSIFLVFPTPDEEYGNLFWLVLLESREKYKYSILLFSCYLNNSTMAN